MDIWLFVIFKRVESKQQGGGRCAPRSAVLSWSAF